MIKTMEPLKVGMVSLGCPKNQVDGEILLGKIKEYGYEITAEADEADIVIVNTCGFIEAAKQESIDNILEFCQMKNDGKIKSVVVTGCLAQRYKDEILKEIPEADVVVGIGANSDIGEILDRAAKGEKFSAYRDKELLPLSGERVLSTLPFYAYLKIGEGCSNFCSYCAIPSIRGRFRSRPMEEVVKEARVLAQKGVKELIVVAQDTTRYGEDLYGEPSLDKLLVQLCGIDGIHWIRILYCYPERITDSLIDVIAREDKICKYIDIPIQHASKKILKAMNRKGDRKSLEALIDKIRKKVDNIVIRTSLIAGFPGETPEDFEELADFVNSVGFERLGCFAYSREEGTPAAKMENQIPEEEKERRVDIIMRNQMFVMDRYNNFRIGKTIEVVCEGYDRLAKIYFGRSAADAPEIDGKVFFYSDRPVNVGEFLNVTVQDVIDFDIIGEAVPQTE